LVRPRFVRQRKILGLRSARRPSADGMYLLIYKEFE